MDETLVPIGEAARRFAVTTAALRFYERRQLVAPAAREGGRRWYGQAELRRIAFIRIAQDLGMNLDEIHALIHGDGAGWRELVKSHIQQLHRQRAWVDATVAALDDALSCPSDHPLLECRHLIAALDERIVGEPGPAAPARVSSRRSRWRS